MACSCGGSCSDCRKHGGRVGKRYNQGGLLRGKSHARGGMPAIIGGKEPVELEGGEYVIRKSSVDKYGEGTMARINQGLVDPNKLRQLKKGGPVKRKMHLGGPPHPHPHRAKQMNQPRSGNNGCPSGTHIMPDGTCMEGEYHGASTNINRRTEMASRRGRRKTTFTGRQGGVRRAATRGRRSPSSVRQRMSAAPSRKRSSRSYKKGGKVGGKARKFQQGGHAHNVPRHAHSTYGDYGTTGGPIWEDMSTLPVLGGQNRDLGGGPHGHGALPNPNPRGGSRSRRTTKIKKGGRISTRSYKKGGRTPTHRKMGTGRRQYRMGGASGGICVEGSGERYTGKTLDIGGVKYSTKGGAKESTSKRLKPC